MLFPVFDRVSPTFFATRLTKLKSYKVRRRPSLRRALSLESFATTHRYDIVLEVSSCHYQRNYVGPERHKEATFKSRINRTVYGISHNNTAWTQRHVSARVALPCVPLRFISIRRHSLRPLEHLSLCRDNNWFGVPVHFSFCIPRATLSTLRIARTSACTNAAYSIRVV